MCNCSYFQGFIGPPGVAGPPGLEGEKVSVVSFNFIYLCYLSKHVIKLLFDLF